MIYKVIDNKYKLQEEFKRFDRDQFSLDGYEAMIDFYNELDEKVKLDVIGLCCSWCEYTRQELINNFNYLGECNFEKLLEKVADDYMVIQLNNGNILLQQ